MLKCKNKRTKGHLCIKWSEIQVGNDNNAVNDTTVDNSSIHVSDGENEINKQQNDYDPILDDVNFYKQYFNDENMIRIIKESMVKEKAWNDEIKRMFQAG